MALSTTVIENRIAAVKERLASPDSYLGGHVDRGPVEFARIRKQWILEGEARLEMLERALAASTRNDLQRQEDAREVREQQQAVCPVCFCKHPGEC